MTLVTTTHMRRFCRVECAIDGYYEHVEAIAREVGLQANIDSPIGIVRSLQGFHYLARCLYCGWLGEAWLLPEQAAHDGLAHVDHSGAPAPRKGNA